MSVLKVTFFLHNTTYELEFWRRIKLKWLRIEIFVTLIATGALAGQGAQPEAAITGYTDFRAQVFSKERLYTHFSGSWRSEILMSQRPMVYLGEGRYAIGKMRVFPFYNTFDMRADNLGVEGLSIHFQGWAGLDLADVFFDQRFVTDLTYMYLQYRGHGFDVKAGRQMVFAGATRGLRIDGVSLTYQSRIHLGVQGLGGLSVPSKWGPDWYGGQFDGNDRDYGGGTTNWQREGAFGDWAAGGRLFYRKVGTLSMGLSILHRSEDNGVAFEEAGADLDITPCAWMAISGNVLLDVLEVGLKEANVGVDIYPTDFLTIGLDYRHADPTLYISHMSIFSVFSDEQFDSVGGSLRVSPIERLDFHGAYHLNF
jgi:hypothetical protein